MEESTINTSALTRNLIHTFLFRYSSIWLSSVSASGPHPEHRILYAVIKPGLRSAGNIPKGLCLHVPADHPDDEPQYPETAVCKNAGMNRRTAHACGYSVTVGLIRCVFHPFTVLIGKPVVFGAVPGVAAAFSDLIYSTLISGINFK